MSTSVPPTTTQEPLVYRPLSAWAVAGFAVGVLYAVIILFAGFKAITQGEPLLMDGYWLIMPLAGILLSVFGRVHILNSDGTRAGLKLTRWGLGLSLCFGLAYFVYSQGTWLAIRNQANRFLMEADEGGGGFFVHLKKSGRSVKDRNTAFLLGQPPLTRGEVRPDNLAAMQAKYNMSDKDGNPGELSRFAGHPLVRLFASGSEDEISVEPLGVRDWSYAKEGFTVDRLYRVTTEEYVTDVRVILKSFEGEQGKRRDWHVVIKDSGPVENPKPRAAGHALAGLRREAGTVVESWVKHLTKAKPVTNFDEFDGTPWDTLIRQPALRDRVRGLLKQTLEGKMIAAVTPIGEAMTWRREDGKLKFFVPVSIDIRDELRSERLKLVGQLTVSSRENVASLSEGMKLTWQVERIALEQALKAFAKGYAPVEDSGGS